MTGDHSDFVLRTSPDDYWTFGGIFSFVVILGLYVSIVKTAEAWMPTITSGLLFAAAIYIFASTKATLTNEALHYVSPYEKHKIPLHDIVRAEFRRGFVAFSYKPFFRIVLTMRHPAKQKEIILNAGLFDEKETKRWVDALNARVLKP